MGALNKKMTDSVKVEISDRKKIETKSSKAGLQFPVGRIARHLKNGRYAKRVGLKAPVFVAAVMEYLTAELLELSGHVAKDRKKTRINPQHISTAVKSDEELGKYLQDVCFSMNPVYKKI